MTNIQQEFQKLHQRLDTFEQKFASKDDLKQFATKDDLKQFATKDDLKQFATKDDLKQFATKHDLSAMEHRLDKKFATKEDLFTMENRMEQKFATKEDLFTMENRMEQKFATKEDLAVQTKELKHYADQQTEVLAAIIQETIAIPLQEHLDNSDFHQGLSLRVGSLEKDVRIIKKQLAGKY